MRFLTAVSLEQLHAPNRIAEARRTNWTELSYRSLIVSLPTLTDGHFILVKRIGIYIINSRY